MLSQASLEILRGRDQVNDPVSESLTVSTSKGIVGISLPPPFIVKQYATYECGRWDGFFQPNHTVIYFQLDVINDNKERRYYGQHYDNNQTFIHDIFHNKRYVFEDGEFQNLVEFHKGNIVRYHKMLVEYYIQP